MKSTAYRFAVESGASAVSAWLQRRRAAILTYHGLIDDEPAPPLRPLYKVMVTVAAFRRQMELLRERYRVVALEELTERIARGDPGERLAAVTFDDGWRTTRTLAAPILHELGLPSIVFVASGLVGSDTRGLWTHRVWLSLAHAPDPVVSFGGERWLADTSERREEAIRGVLRRLKEMPAAERAAAVERIVASCPRVTMPDDLGFMTWDDVRELPPLGMAVGAHTVDHEILSRLTLDAAREQVVRSKARVEEATGQPCRLFAYPNGAETDFGAEHERMIADAGFAAAVTQIPGRNPAGADRYRLKRINIGLAHSLDAFVAELDGLRHWG